MDPYVSPAAVAGLPDAVRARLGERGCLVPLSRNADSLPVPQALPGAFYETGSTGDWAVTCSVPSGARRESTLLVFRSAAGYAADEIESMGWDERGDRRDGPLAARYLTTGISRQSFNATWTLGRQLGARDVARLGITPWESEQRMHDGVQADVGDPALHYWTGRRWVRIALTD